jgi:hypothetical protein
VQSPHKRGVRGLDDRKANGKARWRQVRLMRRSWLNEIDLMHTSLIRRKEMNGGSHGTSCQGGEASLLGPQALNCEMIRMMCESWCTRALLQSVRVLACSEWCHVLHLNSDFEGTCEL